MTIIRRLFKIHDSRLHDERNKISTNTIEYRLFAKYYLDYCRKYIWNARFSFKIFKKLIPFAPDKVDLFVMTYWSLHNYLIKEIIEHHATRSTSAEMNSIERCPIKASSKRAREVLEEIAEYSINEGEVDWKDNYLNEVNLK